MATDTASGIERRIQLNLSEPKDSTSDSSVLSDINICIIDTTFKEIKDKSPVKNSFSRLFIKQRPMTHEEYQNAIDCLYKCCLTGVKDLHELHLRRSLGVEIIEEIIERADSDFITVTNVIHIIWSMMCCIHHYQLRLRLITLKIIMRNRKKEAENCFNTYMRLITKINPSMYRVVLNSIITLYREGRLWEMEFACTALITRLLYLYEYAEEGLEDLIYTIEVTSVSNVIESKYLTEVLYMVFDKIKWEKISTHLIKKVINMVEASISPRPTLLYQYHPLKTGLQNCLRNITTNMTLKPLIILIYFLIKKLNTVDKSESEELFATFGNALVLAAKIYKHKAGRKQLVKGPLPLVFGLFEAQNSSMDLLALRIWKNLIDRNDNMRIFVTPRIFFQDVNYPLVVKPCLKSDKRFFKRFRHLILDISFECFQKAGNRMFLENVYHFMSLTLVEIPCGYTASCFVTVAMCMQEYAFQIMRENLVRANHFHATVMSIMTLICYIHKAYVFYDYVNTIMERRAELAPHLNPPLKFTYHYAQHHILWNKPDLFFEDWETRYGLWHCFRRGKIKSDHVFNGNNSADPSSPSQL